MTRIDETHRRTSITYAQLDRVLRALGFTCREVAATVPTRVYEHNSGALFTTPPLPMKEKVLDYHLAMARIEVDNFGIADPAVFDAELQKAG